MNKTIKIFTLVSIFSLFLFGSSAFAQKRVYQPTGLDRFEASSLIGQRVYSPLGNDLGQIEDLMIDRTDGHIVLAILSGVQGFEKEFVAAPFGALERTGEDAFQLNFGDQYVSSVTTYDEDPYAYQLNENRSIVGLSTIPSKIDPLWADTVYRFYGMTPYWTEGKTPHPDILSYRAERPAILESLLTGRTAPALMGARVHSKDGKAAGRIDDLVIDARSGRVTLLVLDEIPGRGDAQVAIPFKALNRTNQGTFSLSIMGDELVNIPSFHKQDMNTRRYAENVYRFFGLQPYWTEGGIHRSTDPYQWGGEYQDF